MAWQLAPAGGAGQRPLHARTTGVSAPPQQQSNNAAVPLAQSHRCCSICYCCRCSLSSSALLASSLASEWQCVCRNLQDVISCTQGSEQFASDDVAAASTIQKTACGSISSKPATCFVRPVDTTWGIAGIGRKQTPECEQMQASGGHKWLHRPIVISLCLRLLTLRRLLLASALQPPNSHFTACKHFSCLGACLYNARKPGVPMLPSLFQSCGLGCCYFG